MLKKTLALLMLDAAFSAPSWADWSQGHVIQVEPVVSIGFNSGPARFQILYEFAGQRYWTYSDYRPGPWTAIPAPQYIHRYRWVERDYYRWGGDHDHQGSWDNGHRGGWDNGHRGDGHFGGHNRH